MKKDKPIEKYNVQGDFIIKGPINGDLTVYVENCKDVLISGNVSGNSNLNIESSNNDVNAKQNIVTKKYYTLGFLKWIKGLLKI